MVDSEKTVSEPQLQVHELTIPADEGQLSRVRDFVAEVCDEAGFSARETNNTKLAVDEACTNIIKHAYTDGDGDIRIRIKTGAGKVDISLFDRGKKFDFAGVKDPDLDQYVETGKKGGLGVFLINRLMDGVEYHTGEVGNELILRKQSHAAISRALPGKISWRGSLRYKFTFRASLGLFLIIAAIWGYIFVRQTGTRQEQQTTLWLEKRSLATNLANRSKEVLLTPETYSVEQTMLTTFVSQTLEGHGELAYVRVVDLEGTILSSGEIDEIFNEYAEPTGTVLLQDDDNVKWSRHDVDGRFVRQIQYPVRVRSAESGRVHVLGDVYLGVFEDTALSAIKDPRLLTTLIMIGFFLIGVLLISGLVSVFVKPIQVLTDGVRAIGQGTLDGKIDVEGPAEIGAIASVFNEITEKFKKAQESVLEQEKLQKEIEVAKQIQHALLPKRHPDVSGYDIAPYYQAAKEVGGDYYDFVQVDEDTLGVVVADVSGKGVPGSLVMTMIRTALRMEARGNKNASDVMSKMNDFVTDDMKKGMFVTMFYVILDSKNRIISYASAGHNPMILYRAESNDTFFLNPKGFPVGISLPDEALFRQSISLEKIKLKKDDMLLIYTDGVTEAMNEKREQFGEDRLLEVIKTHGHLHPSEFITILEREIKGFTGGNAQNDDITVVAVKEKLTADDVLFGIRKKLIDMVEVDGLSVKEACAKMKVSPATYYRYKKRMALMGERGLRNKVLRQDVDLKRVSLEERKELMEIIQQHPEFGAKRLAEEFNKGKEAANPLTARMVYEELKRLNLNTKDLRIDYLRRNRLLDEDVVPRKTSKEVVEEFLSEVTSESLEEAEREEREEELEFEKEELAGEPLDLLSESSQTIDISVSDAGENVTVFAVDGHLDSVSSSILEKKLEEVITGGHLNIAVDLSKVTYISSGGWGIFVGEVRRLRERSGDVVLVGMATDVYDVYELLGFSDILKALTDLDDARVYFRKPPEERFAMVQEAHDPVADLAEMGDEGESFDEAGYAPEWESLHIEATTVGEHGEIAVISLKGIIDTISAEKLREAIDKVISSGIYKVVVDMSLVEYVSSGGWGTFTERLRELRRQDGDIKLFGMDPDVYYVFTMLGFNIVLSSFDILSDAIEDFKLSAEARPSIHPHHELRESAGAGVPVIEIPREDEDEDEEEEVTPEILDSDHSRPKPASIESKHVAWEDADGILFAKIQGAIEATTVEGIDEEVESRLGAKPRFIVFDLAGVDYISSTGWGIFAKFHQRLAGNGGAVALCGMSGDLYEIFSCLEFHSFINAYANRQEALTACKQAMSGSAPQTVSRPAPPSAPRTDPPAVADRAEDDADTGSRNLDDILGAEEAFPRDTAGGGDGRPPWPVTDDVADAEEPVEDPFETTPWGERRDAADTEKPPEFESPPAPEEPAAKDRFVDFEQRPSQVDVDVSVTDEHIEQDKKLRKMGWGEYGQRLRKRISRKQKPKKDEDES